MDDHNQHDLQILLRHLSSSRLSKPEQWQGWHIEPISGGANNLLFRARGKRGDFAVKFAIRDARNRASREYKTLLALQEAGVQLAPAPILIDEHSYKQPVVVQSWLPGKMVQKPPCTDQEWTAWLQYAARMHEFSPDHTGVDLQQCVDNANGSQGYRKVVVLLQQKAREENLPPNILALVDQLSKLPLAGWAPVPLRLCRADHNVRNFIIHNESLKSVDWEYSGWGDPAEDIAEMVAHATYMDVPDERWQFVIDAYAEMSTIENISERIQLCLAIKLVGWLVRIARALTGAKPDRQRLIPLKGEWRVDTQEKYEYYMQRTQTHLSHFSIA